MTDIPKLLRQFRRKGEALERIKAKMFRHGDAVTVNDPRFTGPGRYCSDNQCPPDKAVVFIHNRDTWLRFPLESVTPAPTDTTPK